MTVFRSINYWFFSWKPIPLLIKEEIAAKNKKCNAKRGDQSTTKKKKKRCNNMKERPQRQHIFIFFALKSFHFVVNFSHHNFLNVPLLFIFLLFYLLCKITLWPISCVVKIFVAKMLATKMLTAKMFTTNMLTVKIPDMLKNTV